MRTALIKEIEKRKAESQLTDQLSQINIGDHVKYVCEKETIKPDSKFKPFATLTHTERSSKMKESQKREVSAALEPSYTKETTKLIPLAESLALQAEQVNRLKVFIHKLALHGLSCRSFPMLWSYIFSLNKYYMIFQHFLTVTCSQFCLPGKMK